VAYLFAEQEFPYALLPEGTKIYHGLFRPPPENTVKVTWRTSLRDYMGDSLQALLTKELLPLGPPDEVRVIYWFNC
jgi:hypothetical protein